VQRSDGNETNNNSVEVGMRDGHSKPHTQSAICGYVALYIHVGVACDSGIHRLRKVVEAEVELTEACAHSNSSVQIEQAHHVAGKLRTLWQEVL
jgi:hypothetical protein